MSSSPAHKHVTLRTYVFTYIALLVLATASLLFAGLPDRVALLIALAIGLIKAILVLFFFMHLVEERFSFRFVMLISFVLVSIFIGLTVLDPLTRAPYPPAPNFADDSASAVYPPVAKPGNNIMPPSTNSVVP